MTFDESQVVQERSSMCSRSIISRLSKTLFNSHRIHLRNEKVTRSFVTTQLLQKKATVNVVYILPDDRKVKAEGKEGDNLLDIAITNEVDLDGFGACEGTLACSTCHLIFKQEDFDKIPEEATDEELDMLDLAVQLTSTSRLGCQVCLTKELSGIEVTVPPLSADARGSP